MDINRYFPSYKIEHKDLLKISDCSNEELFEFLYAVKAMKAKKIAQENTNILNGASIIVLASELSIRARATIEIAISSLGGKAIFLPYEPTVALHENIHDLSSILSRYGVQAMMVRGMEQDELKELAKNFDLTIINLGNESYQPLQGICDMFTIWEHFHKFDGLKLTYVGKGTPVCTSLLMSAAKCGMTVSVGIPAFYHQRVDLENVQQYGTINVNENPVLAMKDADVVYTDSYHQQDESMAEYQVNPALMAFAKPNAQVMHPLPATRGKEITTEVIDGKNSLVYTQGENMLYTIEAVLAMMIR